MSQMGETVALKIAPEQHGEHTHKRGVRVGRP